MALRIGVRFGRDNKKSVHTAVVLMHYEVLNRCYY